MTDSREDRGIPPDVREGIRRWPAWGPPPSAAASLFGCRAVSRGRKRSPSSRRPPKPNRAGAGEGFRGADGRHRRLDALRRELRQLLRPAVPCEATARSPCIESDNTGSRRAAASPSCAPACAAVPSAAGCNEPRPPEQAASSAWASAARASSRRSSWDEALDTIASEMKRIRETDRRRGR